MNKPPNPIVANLHPSESERLAALRSYAILDTAIEPAFEDITRIASYVCQTPISIISLVDEGRQWFKSEIGLGLRETPIEDSICAHAILENSFFEVPDTTKDSRFISNAFVAADPSLRFYAGALLRTPEGYPLGTVCVLDRQPRQLTPEQRDVLAALARQVMSQLELRRALMLSDRLQRNVSRLMAVAGHDLKQPLQVMVMAVDRVRGKLTDPRDRERLTFAADAGMRMAEELDRLAEASGFEGHQATPPTRAFPIRDILDSVVNTWSLHAERKGLRLQAAFSSAVVVSDPVMLRTILGNLVGNAIKYTNSGRVLLGCRRRGQSLLIEVIDSGPGIAEENLATVFEAFRQINPNSEGLGLGLSIVRRTAEILGHPIRVTSRVGHGSRFSVEVPMANASLGAAG